MYSSHEGSARLSSQLIGHDAEYAERLRRAEARERGRMVGQEAPVQAVLFPALALTAFFLLWELGTRVTATPSYLLPAPTEIVGIIVKQHMILLSHGLVSFWEILGGFVASILVGIPLAVAISYSRTFERTIYPLLVSSQAIPKVAIAPLFIVWFGFDWTPKVIVAFLIAFFPIVVDTVVGVKATPVEMIQLAQSMGASQWQRFWLIRFPYALPSIFGGLKVAITLAVVGAIVGEFVGADSGLGYLMQLSNGLLDTRLLFAALTVLSLMGIALFVVIEVLERKVLPWHVSTRGDRV
jgi:NitT/TauT family transport system permease protein